MISSALTLLRILLGPVFSFHALDIAYDARSHAERYGEVLGCPVRTVTTVAEQLGSAMHVLFDVHSSVGPAILRERTSVRMLTSGIV